MTLAAEHFSFVPGPAETLAVLSAGVFFLIGLLTGVWKHAQIMRSEKAQAHPYVDIAHRAALMYSFAALLLAVFAAISALPEMVELIATALPLAFFALAIGSYVVHGWLADTDNQLRKPHLLGRRQLPAVAMSAFMASLILAEIGGFLVLFYGVIRALV